MVTNVKNNNSSDLCKRDVKIITNVTDSVTYIKYTILGSCPTEEISKLPEEIYKLCQKKNIWRVLLDTKNINELNINTMNQVDSGDKIAKVLKSQVRLAVFGAGEIFTKLTEKVAVNRGVNIKVSPNYNVLKSWLLKN